MVAELALSLMAGLRLRTPQSYSPENAGVVKVLSSLFCCLHADAIWKLWGLVNIMLSSCCADTGVSMHRCNAVAVSRWRPVSLEWIVGRLFADKSVSHSLCLVRPNTPGADHSLPAYKLKQIALSMLYYVLCCRVLYQTSHWGVVLVSQRLMTGASTLFSCLKLRTSNDHRHNLWEVLQINDQWFIAILFLSGFYYSLFVYSSYMRDYMCMLHFEKTNSDSHWFTDLTKGYIFQPLIFWGVCVQ